MIFLIKIFKTLAFIILVITFLSLCSCIDLLIRNKAAKLRRFSRISSGYLKAALIVLGVKVTLKNIHRLNDADKSYFIVSNHLSYLDIMAISSVTPSVFVANSELEEAFLLGPIIRYSGGIFIERRNRARLLSDMQNIKNILNMGVNVVLFPEGTTSDGKEVKPFKTPLLSVAVESGAEVLPLCIRYRKINGRDVDAGNGHLVYYHGNIGFFEHFFRLLTVRSVSVELRELEVIRSDSHYSRKEIAKIAHDMINGAYGEAGESRI